MAKEPIVNIVAIQVKPEHEARFNRWMEEVHIPMLLKYKGLVRASRYKSLNPEDILPQYITQYEFVSKQAFDAYESSPELTAAKEEMKQSWKQGEIELKTRVPYQLVRVLP
jgi:antibiotic biosynthesis monooxygenase (ABM) superfamily enzyme